MEISELTLRLLLLFLPGIIITLILERLTVSDEKRHFYFILSSFLYGIFSYAFYALLLIIFDCLPRIEINTNVIFLDALIDEEIKINFGEILKVSIISVVLGFFIATLINQKYLHRFSQFIGISKKFAEIDVWGYLLNSKDDELRWVRVRDTEHNLCFEGWIEAFSDTHKNNELFLRDVIVFKNDTGDKLYNVPGLYISRNPDNLTVEFYALQTDLKKKFEEKENE